MGQSIITVVLKTFDVGFGIEMWHFPAVFTVYLTKPKLAHIGVLVFVVTIQCRNSETVPYFAHECRLIGTEEPFIAHSAEQVHPFERELVITGLQGAIIEYCFREWLTPSCFVFARQETSEADRRDSVKAGWEWDAVKLYQDSFLYLFFLCL